MGATLNLGRAMSRAEDARSLQGLERKEKVSG